MHWVTLLLVAWLPGAVLFRIPVLDRQRRGALDAGERVFWSIILSTALSLSIVLALAAVGRYSFERLILADCGIALLLGATGVVLSRRKSRVTPGPAHTTPAWRRVAAMAFPLLLACAGFWRFLPASEYIIGGKDPGVYVNEGVQIAQRGALVVHDGTVASVPPGVRDLFLPSHDNPTYYSVRFMCFFIKDPDAGTVVGQFPHLFPASIAIGYGVDGLTGARSAVVFWAVLGLLAVYFTGARWIGPLPAAAATVLLFFNVIELWFARYPNTELVMQALGFAALLANARAHADGDPFFSPVAGVLLGLLLFLRIDAVLTVAALLAGQALGMVAAGYRRPRASFWIPLAAAAVLNWFYLAGPMRAYAELPRVFLSNFQWWQYALIALAGAGGLVLFVAALRSPRASAAVRRWSPIACCGVVLALAAYALFLRHPGGKLTDYDAYALRTYANFYVTLPAVIAALAGYVIVSRTFFWRDAPLLVVFTAFSCFFFYKIRIVPDHFWMARRFVPVILPGTLLLASATALAGRWRGHAAARVVRSAIGIAFLGVLAMAYARASRPIAHYVEYAGIIPRLERLAGRIGDRDLVVVESRDTGSDVHVFALPLAYIYARNVLMLSSAAPDKLRFADFLRWARSRYDRVLFLGSGGTDLLSSRWSVRPLDSERFQVPEYDSEWNAYPQGVREKEFDYALYAIDPPTPARGPIDMPIGINDDLNVVRFFAKEKTEGHPFRWTHERSFIVLPRLDPSSRTLALWMSNGGRPPHAPPADVTVLVDDRELGTVHVGRGFAEYDLAIPPELARAAGTGEPVRVVLRTSTWNPARLLGGNDDRDLGVMVERVAVR